MAAESGGISFDVERITANIAKLSELLRRAPAHPHNRCKQAPVRCGRGQQSKLFVARRAKAAGSGEWSMQGPDGQPAITTLCPSKE
jgi:hypothetical protein